MAKHNHHDPTVSALVDEIVRLKERLNDVEKRTHNIVRHGKVVKVDPQTGQVKVVDETDQEEASASDAEGGDTSTKEKLRSPMMDWLEPGAGFGKNGLKKHTPPNVGARGLWISPGGDPANGFFLAGLYSDDNPRPSQKSDEEVTTIGDLTVTKRGDKYDAVLGDNHVRITKTMVRGRVGKDDTAGRFVATQGGAKIRKGTSWVVVDGSRVIVSSMPVVGGDSVTEDS